MYSELFVNCLLKNAEFCDIIVFYCEVHFKISSQYNRNENISQNLNFNQIPCHEIIPPLVLTSATRKFKIFYPRKLTHRPSKSQKAPPPKSHRILPRFFVISHLTNDLSLSHENSLLPFALYKIPICIHTPPPSHTKGYSYSIKKSSPSLAKGLLHRFPPARLPYQRLKLRLAGVSRKSHSLTIFLFVTLFYCTRLHSMQFSHCIRAFYRRSNKKKERNSKKKKRIHKNISRDDKDNLRASARRAEEKPELLK